ncbi:L-seryl-tRNA(Sec) selenium transferase, partial [Comamonas sp.]
MSTTAATSAEISHPSQLPAVDKVLLAAEMQPLREAYGLDACTKAARTVLTHLRQQLLGSADQPGQPVQADLTSIVQSAQRLLQARFAPRLQPVLNLTGTVLHTNLGRALLPQAAIDAVVQAMSSPANLEYDLQDGSRGDRDDLVESLICELTGAEAATVVNNNAAAVLLVLSTMAMGKEVIVSRGELVEIGGAFRIPDVMTRAGAKLIEVGTTNRTHEKDYAGAISEHTGALMKVHCSNYAITGFTKAVSDAD